MQMETTFTTEITHNLPEFALKHFLAWIRFRSMMN